MVTQSVTVHALQMADMNLFLDSTYRPVSFWRPVKLPAGKEDIWLPERYLVMRRRQLAFFPLFNIKKKAPVRLGCWLDTYRPLMEMRSLNRPGGRDMMLLLLRFLSKECVFDLSWSVYINIQHSSRLLTHMAVTLDKFAKTPGVICLMRLLSSCKMPVHEAALHEADRVKIPSCVT